MKNDQNKPGYYNYYFSGDRRQCTVVAYGEVDFEQSVQLMDDVVNDPGFHKDMLLLVNLKGIQYHPDYNEFISLKDHLKSLKPHLNNRIALVCTRKMDILAHLMCAFLKENVDIKTFIRLEEAENWLKMARKVGHY
jgi:hypothetical protein